MILFFVAMSLMLAGIAKGLYEVSAEQIPFLGLTLVGTGVLMITAQVIFFDGVGE